MPITFRDLANKFGWEEIEPVLSKLYPKPKKEIAEYKEAYQKFMATIPVQTKMRVVVEENWDPDFGTWYQVYGKNGTLVKDVLPEYPRQHEDIQEQEQGYALSYTDWAELAGMEIDTTTLTLFPGQAIIVHVLMEMTWQWHSDKAFHKVNEEIKAIQEGRGRNVVRREQLFKGGLQIWSEKEDGEFHGWFTTYWGNGPIVRQQGIIVDGNKEGVWTVWNQNGRVRKQVRYWCDRALEIKTVSPWWNDVKDQ